MRVTFLTAFLTGAAALRAASAAAHSEKHAPTLVTTNRSLPGWGEIFGDEVVAGAVLDRILHRCVVFNIRGPSWRMREHQALAEAARRPDDPPAPNGGGRRGR